MRYGYCLILLFVFIMISSATTFAQTTKPSGEVQIGGFYSGLTKDQGPWSGLDLRAKYHFGTTTLIGEFINENREVNDIDHTGQTVALAGYHDFSKHVFTLTALQVSTATPNFPKVRFHQEVDFKVGPQNKLVIGIGGGYVRYFDRNESPYVALGAGYYFCNNANLHYQYLKYTKPVAGKRPGTHIVSLSLYHKDGSSPVQFEYVHGQDTYRANGIASTLSPQTTTNSFSLQKEWKVRGPVSVVTRFEHAQYSNSVTGKNITQRWGGDFSIVYHFK